MGARGVPAGAGRGEALTWSLGAGCERAVVDVEGGGRARPAREGWRRGRAEMLGRWRGERVRYRTEEASYAASLTTCAGVGGRWRAGCSSRRLATVAAVAAAGCFAPTRSLVQHDARWQPAAQHFDAGTCTRGHPLRVLRVVVLAASRGTHRRKRRGGARH